MYYNINDRIIIFCHLCHLIIVQTSRVLKLILRTFITFYRYVIIQLFYYATIHKCVTSVENVNEIKINYQRLNKIQNVLIIIFTCKDWVYKLIY